MTDCEKLIFPKRAEIKPSGIRKFFGIAANMDNERGSVSP